MYFDDHGPPHFHARHAEGIAKVRIDTLEVIESKPRPPTAALRARVGRATPGRAVRELAPRPRDTSGGRATQTIGLTPDITDAHAVCHGVLSLIFADGLEGEVAVLERMRGPVFAHARTREGFGEVAVDRETGTVSWPGGADLAPDTLYERVRTGAWPDHDLAG